MNLHSNLCCFALNLADIAAGAASVHVPGTDDPDVDVADTAWASVITTASVVTKSRLDDNEADGIDEPDSETLSMDLS